MASYEVKVEYGGQRFATFLLEDISYEGLLFSIKKICSFLTHLDGDNIRLRYSHEDGDMANISKEDDFAFSEMLRTTKHVEGLECKKIFITANEIDSPVSRKIRRLGDGTASPGTSAMFISLH